MSSRTPASERLHAALADPAAFDAAVAELGAEERVLPLLVAGADPDVLTRATRAFRAGLIANRELFGLGRVALWAATRELIVMASRVRTAPWPPHERWDALLGVESENAEAAWLLAELFEGMHADQGALGRRMLLGVERRFGARGWRIMRLRAGDGPLAELLPPTD